MGVGGGATAARGVSPAIEPLERDVIPAEVAAPEAVRRGGLVRERAPARAARRRRRGVLLDGQSEPAAATHERLEGVHDGHWRVLLGPVLV